MSSSTSSLTSQSLFRSVRLIQTLIVTLTSDTVYSVSSPTTERSSLTSTRARYSPRERWIVIRRAAEPSGTAAERSGTSTCWPTTRWTDIVRRWLVMPRSVWYHVTLTTTHLSSTRTDCLAESPNTPGQVSIPAVLEMSTYRPSSSPTISQVPSLIYYDCSHDPTSR